MLRIRNVQGLMFEWGKEWRKGSEPNRLNYLFQAMVEGREFRDLCDYVIADITAAPVSSGHHLGPLQIGAVIAAMLVIRPGELGPGQVILDRDQFLAKIQLALIDESEEQTIEFQQGCILGLLQAVVTLAHLDDYSFYLENRVWPLVMIAAEKADFHTKQSLNFAYAGRFSNILADYLDQAKVLDGRWECMEKTIIRFSRMLKRRGWTLQSFPKIGATRFLVNEIVHKLFGRRADEGARFWMVCKYFGQKKQKRQ